MADDVNNIQIQQQLNKLLDDQKRILRENTRSLREQANLTQKMVESLGQANISNNVVEKSKNLKKSLKEASDEARTFSSTSRDMASAVSDALGDTDDGFEGLMNTYAKASGKAGKWGALTGGFIEGIGKGFNLLKTGLSGVLSLTGSVVRGMFSIGKSILAIPFKVFNAFVAEANRMQGEPLLAREFEETRKAFGDFGEDLSKHVIGGFRNLKGELADTGLNVYRVLGYRHEQLKFVREQFEALGATAHVFGLEIASQAEYFAAYQKGLGLSGEMMKGLAQATMGTGETFEETLRTTTNFTTSLGKQFGVSQKVIGRDVGEMAKDLKNFGSVGVRQMAQMSVYARKLGVDFKDLLGIVDRFDNFEDAAESAARLAQAFGLNIDAMEMINEQDPAARVDKLRKAFYATGKDITKLTRQERNYLATTAGIEDQALNAVFALDKQSMSYEEITAAGQTAEQQQITQAEAMEKLSDSIERMIKSGRRTGGFFDRFMKGFRRGVRWSGEFRDVMYNIKRSLWATERAGRRVGRIFIKAFPGLKQFLKGMSQLFEPQKFKILGGKVVKSFRKFLKELGDPKKSSKALGNLLDSLKKAFFGMENSQRGAMSNIVNGLKKAFGAIGKIILSGIKIALRSLGKLFKALTKMIKGESTFPDAIRDAFGKAGETGANALLDIWFEIAKELGPVAKELWSAFKELLDVLWKKIQDWWKNIDWAKVMKEASPALKVALGVLFGPAMFRAASGIVGSFMKDVLMKAIMGSGGALSKGASAAGKYLGPLLANPIALSVAAGIAVIAGMYAYTISEANKVWGTLDAQADKEIAQLEQKKAAHVGHLENLKAEKSLIESIHKNNIEGTLKEIELLNQKGKISKEQIEAARKAEMAKLDEQLAGLRKLQVEMDKQSANKQLWKDSVRTYSGALGGVVGGAVGAYVTGGSSDKYKEIAEQLKLLKQQEKINSDRIKLSEKYREQAESAVSQKEIEQKLKAKAALDSLRENVSAGSLDIQDGDFGLYNKVKNMKSEKVKKVIENFNKNIKPLLINDLRQGILDIGKAFAKDQDSIGNAILAMNVIGKFADVKKYLLAFAGISKVNKDSLKSAYTTLRDTAISLGGKGFISSFEKLSKKEGSITGAASFFDGIGTITGGLNLLSKEFEKVQNNKATKNKDKILESVNGIISLSSDIYTNLTSAVSKEVGENFAITDLPAVKIILAMTKAVNTINDELSTIKKVDVKSKLENLGKALGMKGSESIRIEHENFNVDINVTVELDPNKLADAIVDTGKVVKSTKAPRK